MRIVHPLHRSLTVAVILAGAGGCRHHVAPSYETVVTRTEERAGSAPMHVVHVENRSSEPVTVYSAGLTDCDNIADPCTPHPMDLRVGPGKTQVVLRIVPASADRAFAYRFQYSWRAGTLDRTLVLAPAGSPDVRARQQAAIRQRGDSVRAAEAAAGYTFIGQADFTPLAGRVAALRVVGDSIVLAIGQTARMGDMRFVLVDADGRVLGSTLWVRWTAPAARVVQFVSGTEFVARAPGRALLVVALADEAQRMLGQTVGELGVPIVVTDSATGRSAGPSTQRLADPE